MIGVHGAQRAQAITSNHYPPIRDAIAWPANQPQLQNGICHDQWACNTTPPTGSNTTNYWSVDLFDSTWQSQNGSVIYATNYNTVQATNTSGSVSVRYGTALSGAGHGYYNGHGRLGSIFSGVSVGQPVSPGQAIMKMGDTGTTAGNGHLHFEVRYMNNVTQWSSNFNGMCGKHYINKMMNNVSPYPLTLGWSTGFGGINNCKGLTS